jgi:hypothetical protein
MCFVRNSRPWWRQSNLGEAIMKYAASYLVAGRWVAVMVSVPTFVAAWVYCATTYGFLLGVGLGWLPSLITAYATALIVRLLWVPISLSASAFFLWLEWGYEEKSAVVVFAMFGAVFLIGWVSEVVSDKRRARQYGDAHNA